MKSSATSFITDVKGYVQALFEDAVGKPIESMEDKWEEVLNRKTSDSVAKMTLAYELAQPYKDELPFYGLLCIKLCFCLYKNFVMKRELYEEALKHLNNPAILEYAQLNYEVFCEIREAENVKGIQPQARKYIQNVERLDGLMGDDDWNLHDGVIHSMHYDREKDELTVVVDTYCSTWSANGNETYLVPFHFSDSVNIECDLDAYNDYIWTSRIYLLNGFIYVEFDSVYLKISSKSLSIGEIVAVQHQKEEV